MSRSFLLSSLFFFLFIVSFLIVIALFPNLVGIRSGFQYTGFDSMMFYDTGNNLSIKDLNSDGYEMIAYKAYPIYLISFVEILKFLNIDVNYQFLLCSNLIIVALTLVLYSKVLVLDKKMILYVFVLFALFEPSFFGFALTLEREVFVSFFLGLTCFCYLKLNGILKYLLLFSSFFILLNLRVEILFIVFMAVFVYDLNKILLRQTSRIKKYLLIFTVSLFISILLYFLSVNFGSLYLDFIELQLDNSNKGGIGGKILAMPFLIRTILYSILYFFLPFPIHSIFIQEIVFPYENFVSISAVSYLFLWLYILKNFRFIKGKANLVFIICIIGHVVLGGTLFNYRHRVDLIVSLTILFLNIISSKVVDENFTARYIFRETKNVMLTALFTIIFLNLFLYIIL